MRQLMEKHGPKVVRGAGYRDSQGQENDRPPDTQKHRVGASRESFNLGTRRTPRRCAHSARTASNSSPTGADLRTIFA